MKKKVEVIDSNDLELDIELDNQELEKDEVDNISSTSNHYVDNKKLLQAFIDYQPVKQAWIESGKEGPAPRLPEIVGHAILQIATRFAYKPRYVKYAPNWKEEMILHSVDICVRYVHNFNPEKSSNPFGYITQIVSHGFKQVLRKEHKQQYVKMCMFDDTHGFAGDIDDQNVNMEDMDIINETNDIYRDRLEYIDKFEKIVGMNKTKKKKELVDENNLFSGSDADE